MAKKEKSNRECGYCHKTNGHNARTCPQKKADMAAAAQSSANGSGDNDANTSLIEQAAAAARAAQQVSQQVGVPVIPTGNVSEFEEMRKQVQVGGRTLTASIRRYNSGATQFVLKTNDESNGPREEVLDIASAGKLYELLGWCLQNHQARNTPKVGPVVRTTNGAPVRQDAAS